MLRQFLIEHGIEYVRDTMTPEQSKAYGEWYADNYPSGYDIQHRDALVRYFRQNRQRADLGVEVFDRLKAEGLL